MILSVSLLSWGAIWSILGLFGLFLDALGALLIVAVDVSVLAWVFERGELHQRAQLLRDARQLLFQSGKIVQEDRGFDQLLAVIKRESGTDLDPRKIRAKPPGTYGGGGNVFLYEGEDTEKPHGGVGSHNLVDGWIKREIENLEEGRKNRIRWVGMLLLLLGFSAQIVSYYVTN